MLTFKKSAKIDRAELELNFWSFFEKSAKTIHFKKDSNFCSFFVTFSKKFFSRNFFKNIIYRGKKRWKIRIRRQKNYLTLKNLLKWQKIWFLICESSLKNTFFVIYKVFSGQKKFLTPDSCFSAFLPLEMTFFEKFWEKNFFEKMTKNE